MRRQRGSTYVDVIRVVIFLYLIVLAYQTWQSDQARKHHENLTAPAADGGIAKTPGEPKATATVRAKRTPRPAAGQPPPPPAARDEQALRAAIREQLVAAATAVRGKKPDAATRALQRAGELVQQIPPGQLQRIDTLASIGRHYWSLRAFPAAGKWLTAAADEIELRKAARIGAGPTQQALPWKLTHRIYRYLGLVYREQRDPGTAAAWFARARQVAERAPAGNDSEHSTKFMTVAADAYEEGRAYCEVGEPEKAADPYQAVTAACAKLRRPETVYTCKRTRVCN